MSDAPTSQELLMRERRNAETRELLREVAKKLRPKPDFTLPIRYLNGEQSPIDLHLNRWVHYGQWRFKQYDGRPGRAAAFVIADGRFAFGPHQHTCHETYLVREGRLKDSGPDGKNARLLIPGQSFSVAAGSFHAPEVLSDGCELIIEWRWPGDSLQPPGFDE